MINQQILDYVRQQLAAGVVKDDIKKSLITQGWLEQDVVECFTILEKPTANPLQASSPIVSPIISTQQANITPVSITQHYAGFWIRTAAILIDGVIWNLVLLLLSIILSLPTPTILSISAKFFSSSAFLIIPFFIINILLIRKFGQTPGKMIVGIKIISEDGELGIWKIFLREVVGKIVSSLIFLIGYFMVAFTAHKKGLHDMIASTAVVYTNENRKVLAFFLALFSLILNLALLFGLFFGSVISIFNKLGEANTVPVVSEQQNPLLDVSPSTTTEITPQNIIASSAIETSVVTKYEIDKIPTGIFFDSNSKSIWITSSDNTVSKVDIKTGKSKEYKVGVRPYGIAFDSATNSVWVTNQGASSVSKINIQSGVSIEYKIEVSPFGIVFDPVTNSVWTANQISNTLSKINVNNGESKEYKVGEGPTDITFDPVTKSVWVANAKGYDVSKVNILTGESVTYKAGTFPSKLIFDSATNSIWAGSPIKGLVYKINVENGETKVYKSVVTVPNGALANFLAFDPITNSIWVANYGSDSLTKINIETGETREFLLDKKPDGIIFDSGTKSIVIINENSNIITKINVSNFVSTSSQTPSTGAQIDVKSVKAAPLNFATPISNTEKLVYNFILGFKAEADKYFARNGSYVGLKDDSMIKYRTNTISKSVCGEESRSIFTMSPDQKSFSVYEPLCGNQGKSYCYDNNVNAIIVVDTTSVINKYQCK